MSRRVALMKNDVTEERAASIIKAKRISDTFLKNIGSYKSYVG
jgi:hypothetical protein